VKSAIPAGLTLIACLLSTTGFGQQKPGESREAFYRCKDVNGQTRFGSAMPPECVGRDTDVLNDRGTVLRTIEGAGTRASRMEKEANEAEAQRIKEEQYQRDKVLIETYLSVAEIESLRDQRLDLLTAQLRVAEQHIATLRERLVRLREQSARFKPYSDKPNAPPLPDHIAEDLVGTLKSIAVDQQTIDIKSDEQAKMTSNFDRDIKRFKELKGIK
jgi:hypothetical protein